MSRFLDIIIPTYNTKDEYLIRALNSINIQKNINFKEIGIIIVDDKSKGVFNKSIFKKFPKLNIMFYKNKVNLGQGLARQVGLDQSDAKYVTFVDQDDMLANDMVLAKCISQLIREDHDCMFSMFAKENYNGTYTIYDYNSMRCLHGLFVKTEYLKENDIGFNKRTRYHEDSYFTSLAYQMMKRGSKINEITYLWMNNKDSVVRKIRKHNFVIETFDDYFHVYMDIAMYFQSHLNDNYGKNISFINSFLINFVMLSSNKFNYDDLKDKRDYYQKMLYALYLKYNHVFEYANNNPDINYESIINDCLNANRIIMPDIELQEDLDTYLNRMRNLYPDINVEEEYNKFLAYNCHKGE